MIKQKRENFKEEKLKNKKERQLELKNLLSEMSVNTKTPDSERHNQSNLSWKPGIMTNKTANSTQDYFNSSDSDEQDALFDEA